MASERVSTFPNVYIKYFRQMIHRSAGEKISQIMNVYVPNWLRMTFESLSTGSIEKVPDFDCAVTTACQKMETFGMEFNWTKPLFVSFAWHYKFSLRTIPKFPRKIVTHCCNDWLFRMQGDACNCHVMAFESFIEYCVFIIIRLQFFFSMGIWPVIRWKRRKFNLLGSFCSLRLFFKLLINSRFDRTVRLIHFSLNLSSCLQSIPLEFYQHFFFHDIAIFFSHLIIFLFLQKMIVPEFFELWVQFFLFLLNSLVMHFIKVPFFQKFIVGSSSLFCHNDRLIKLISFFPSIFSHLLAFYILFRDFTTPNYFSSLLKLKPFLLEIVQCFIHFVSNEEIPEERIKGDRNRILCLVEISSSSVLIKWNIPASFLVVANSWSSSSKSEGSTLISLSSSRSISSGSDSLLS